MNLKTSISHRFTRINMGKTSCYEELAFHPDNTGGKPMQPVVHSYQSLLIRGPIVFSRANRRRQNGFTLIELLVVMAIIATLLTIAVPRYFNSVERSRETVLHQNLAVTRQALDKYYGDNGKYPDSLDELVSKKYLRSLPADPIAGNATAWLIVPPDAPGKGEVFDIKSGAPGNARDGSEYKDW